MDLTSTRKHLKSLGIAHGLTNALIAQEALARDIEIAPDEKSRLTMRWKGRRIWFDAARSNINNSLARRCTLHKDVASRLLRTYNVPAPHNAVFSARDVELAWQWAEPRLPVVIKPSDGGEGELVHLDLRDSAAFREAFSAVGAAAEGVLVEEFVPGVEHRVLLVHGKVVAATRRIPAHVDGDGENTVTDLVAHKNIARAVLENPVHWDVPLDDISRSVMAEQGFTESMVPAEGQRVWIRRNSNIHSGGDAMDATDDLTAEEVDMAEKVVRAIPGLRLVGLDMLLPRDGEGDAPRVLEVNSSPMLSGHHFPWIGKPRDAAGALLSGMYPDSAARRRLV
ncbi:hypothetical protein [Nesterenkonia sp. HG001]|uniref:hypothetical protein n=1 Tax=Nesterenkonia sp. HG001 TaxID=2983207 RepID=UPI002AC55557|nr:hypothetical protein [Nesterenkonia sp. HG001]MDZ5079152.1 hypothetical protein [Nesterenkonia sp. HG001]